MINDRYLTFYVYIASQIEIYFRIDEVRRVWDHAVLWGLSSGYGLDTADGHGVFGVSNLFPGLSPDLSLACMYADRRHSDIQSR